jgi:uncharacterized protein (DUF1501 family)
MNFKNFAERREFLKAAATVSVAGALPTLDALTSVAHAAAPGTNQTTEIANDYKAIVCVFLFGGQDHANLVVPYQDNATSGQTEYSCYSASRSYNNAPQSENKSTGNLSYSRATLGGNAEARVITSADTPSMPAGFTTNVFGRKFALHPNFSEIAYHYKQSKLALIANTGPSVGVFNRHGWYNRGSVRPSLPVNLYSHDDQQKGWMSGRADQLNPIEGAGGRIAEQVVAMNGNSQISTSISVAGINTFLLTSNVATIPYQVGSGSVGRIQVSGTPSVTSCNTSSSYINANPGQAYCLQGGPIRVSNGYSWNSPLMSAFLARVASSQNPPSIYMNQWGDIMDQSIRTEQAVAAALLTNPLNEDTVKSFREYVPSSNPGATPIDIVSPPGTDPFPGSNSLAAQLRMVATLIRASAALGQQSPSQPMKRQIFFVSLGGFDTHGDEFWGQNGTLTKRLDRALDAFWQALGKIKVSDGAGGTVGGASAQNQVTVFTMSDFGRTLDSNGKGSDHGWGNHHFVLGGAVKGGMIYGANHNVALGDIPNDTSNGGKSRYMIEDLSAGAFPRVGIPPLWYDNTQGSTAPGGKARMLIPGTSQYLPLNHVLDRGELMPTMASDAYVATIARWFGVSSGQLATVFPKLANAHPNFDTTNGVGFMNLT